MLPGVDSALEGGPPKGPTLEIELFSAHARIAGSVNLGAYTRLSDLLSFHDDILAVENCVVLSTSGEPTADRAPVLDVRLESLTLVIDKSNYVPPPDAEQTIEKKAHRMLALTEAHVITATFFIYPGAEPAAYLKAHEPRWIPVADVRLTSLIDSKIEVKADFAVLHRTPVILTTLL
ncbi:MAG: hypothetical protein ABI578_09645 [Chloroflexota bacterium]